MIHSDTTNKSFLKMHYILKNMGISNNTFFLQLYDETLHDIDPLDEAIKKLKTYFEEH